MVVPWQLLGFVVVVVLFWRFEVFLIVFVCLCSLVTLLGYLIFVVLHFDVLC